MNNKFSENLKKIRKDNNISQEQLAEELSVSRQAISKWESGTAYPEMEKIILICKKYEVNIDDLLYKDINEVKGEEASKNNISKFIDSFLNFIADTINMFSRMNFKSKIKCLFEQCIVCCILIVLCLIFGTLFDKLISGLFSAFSFKVFNIISNILETIFYTLMFIISFSVLTYIFKIRYLDYYLKIKDDASKKEEKVENTKENINNELSNTKMSLKAEEKIIIRDPQNTEYRFVNSIIKLFILGIKIFTCMILAFMCSILVGISIGLICSFMLLKTGIFFIGILLSFISAGIITIVIILLLLNFIFNRKNDKKKMIWSFILSVIGLGIGCGLTFCGTLNFDYIKNDPNAEIKTIVLDMDSKMVFDSMYYECEYVEKNISNVEIEYKSNKYSNETILKYSETIIINSTYQNPFDVFRYFISNLNERKIINLNNDIYDIKIYASKENIQKLKDNYNKYYSLAQ